MRVLILGSEGVIGKSLAERLQASGHSVTKWDKELSLDHDLADPGVTEHLLPVITACDFIFFLAFDVGGSKYIKAPTLDFMNQNCSIMLNTFSLLKDKKFIFASSTMSNIHVPYGTLKAIGEHYTKILGGTSVRFWNVYGRESFGRKSHVITDFIHMFKTTSSITMLTDGSELRQFLHSKDCAACLEQVMLKYTDLPNLIDITSFEWVKIRHVAETITHNIIVPSVLESDSHQNIMNEPDRFILQHWQPTITLKEGILDLQSAYGNHTTVESAENG
jgi:nucleoside-diphosphate-sugar epimerase